MEKMKNDRIAKRIYVGERAGSHSVSRPRKRWIDTVQESLRRRSLDVRQARRMVNDKSVWQGFCEGECTNRTHGDKPLTLTRCHSFMKPWKGGNPSVAKPTIKRKKESFYFFIYLNFTNLLLALISWHDAFRPRGGGNWLKYNK